MARTRLSRFFIPMTCGLAGLVCLLVLLGVSGCFSADDEEVTHLVLLTGGGQVGEASMRAVARFEKDYPHIRVKIITAPGSDYYVKALTMLAGRAHVDVMWMGEGFSMFASRGALLDLEPLITADPNFHLDDYYQPVVDWYRFQDRLYGVPYGIDLQVMAYNQASFDEAGLPYPTDSWTAQDFAEAGRLLTIDRSGDGRFEQFGLGFSEFRPESFGLDLLSEDYRYFGMNHEGGRQWLDYCVNLQREGVLRRAGEEESIDRLTEFLGQRVAVIEFYSWDLPTIRNQADFPWDLAAPPLGPDGRNVGWASSSGFCIARHTRHPEASWKLLRYLVSESFQQGVMDRTIPSLKHLHDGYLGANPPPPQNLTVLLETLEDARPSPRIAGLREVRSEWEYWREMARLGKLTPEQALDKAEESVNRILEVHRVREARSP